MPVVCDDIPAGGLDVTLEAELSVETLPGDAHACHAWPPGAYHLPAEGEA